MGFPRLLCGNELIAVEERRTGGKLDAEGIEAIEEMRRLTIFLDYLTSPTPASAYLKKMMDCVGFTLARWVS